MKSRPGGNSSRPETQVTSTSASAVRSRTRDPSASPRRFMSSGFMRRVRVTSRYWADALSPTLVPCSVERPGIRMNRSDPMTIPAIARFAGDGTTTGRLRLPRFAPAASPPGYATGFPSLREGVLGRVLLTDHAVHGGLPLHRPLDGFLGRAVVVVVDLLVVARRPVDEDAHEHA